MKLVFGILVAVARLVALEPWVVYGTVYAPVSETFLQEPTVLYTTTDCVVLSNPCFQMYYTGNSNATWYAESADGKTNWTRYTSSVVAGHTESSVLKIGSTYYFYGVNTGVDHTKIDLYTSSANNPVSFTLNTAAVLTIGTAGTWDDTLLWNNSVIRVDATHWYMIYEATGTTHNGTFECGSATSSDGITWVKGSLNPTSGPLTAPAQCGNPWLTNFGASFYYWAGAGQTCAGSTSQFTLSSTTVFNSVWPSVVPAFCSDGMGAESSYAADPTLIQVGSQTYMYYAASNGVVSVIRLAIANQTIAQLVGATTGGSSYSGKITFDGPVAGN